MGKNFTSTSVASTHHMYVKCVRNEGATYLCLVWPYWPGRYFRREIDGYCVPCPNPHSVCRPVRNHHPSFNPAFGVLSQGSWLREHTVDTCCEDRHDEHDVQHYLTLKPQRPRTIAPTLNPLNSWRYARAQDENENLALLAKVADDSFLQVAPSGIITIS